MIAQKYGELKMQLEDANRLKQIIQKQQDHLMEEMKQDQANYEKKLRHKQEMYDKLEKSVAHRINSINSTSDENTTKLN